MMRGKYSVVEDPTPGAPRQLDFIFKEYIGLEVLSLTGRVLRAEANIYPGCQVLIPTATGGFWKGVVKSTEQGYCAEDEHWMCPLEYAQDDRDCWVCGGFISKAWQR